MTERTIRSMAKKLASVFYEENRSPQFRATFPTLKDYIRGQWHQPNGDIVINKPGWMYHLNLARNVMLQMLDSPMVNPHLKEAIYNAWLEEHAAGTGPTAKHVIQHKPIIPIN